jgi:hypothetical protein
VVRNGHLRRSADLGRWLRQHLEDQPQTERHKEAKTQLLNTIIALIAPSASDQRVRLNLLARSQFFGVHVNHLTSLK